MEISTRENGTRRVRILFDASEGKTKSEFKKECEIQTILNKYQKTGMVTHLARHKGHYGDFSKVTDFQSASIQLSNALQTFQELPSSIRAMFDNDPSKLIDFVENKENKEKAIELGLLPKEKVKAEVTQSVTKKDVVATEEQK